MSDDRVQIPNWVPPIIRNFAPLFSVGSTIATRLLTNERMKNIWLTLSRIPTGPEQATDNEARKQANEDFERMESWQTPEHWGLKLEGPTFDRFQTPADWGLMVSPVEGGLQIRNISPQERACVAIFCFAVVELSSKRPVWTNTRIADFKEGWKAAEKLCHLILLETAMFDENFVVAAKGMLDGLEKYKPLLAKGGLLSGQYNPAYFIPNDSANGDVRVKARALIKEMKRLYGTTNRGSIATICNVGLNLSPEITVDNIADWDK
jgi:hypothetical protein